MTERERFEQWVSDPTSNNLGHRLEKKPSGDYKDDYISDMWDGWQARAQADSQAPVAHILQSDLDLLMKSAFTLKAILVNMPGKINDIPTVPLYAASQPTIAPSYHVGYSKFEEWFSTHPTALHMPKQFGRDAYAAGLAEGLAAIAPSVAHRGGDKDVVTREQVESWARTANIKTFSDDSILAKLGTFAILARKAAPESTEDVTTRGERT